MLTNAVAATGAGTDDTLLVALIAAVALVVGALLSFAAAYLTGRFTAQANLNLARERQRLDDRRARRAFQRKTLLAALAELTKYGRATGKIYVFDRRTFLNTGSFTQMGAELDAEMYAAGVSFMNLIERIVDDDVRTALREVHDVDPQLLVPRSLPQLEEAWTRFGERLVHARGVLGPALRAYLAEDVDQT
jgi:hypothetical protein